MKITTLILLTALLQVSAASFGQKVTIVKNNIALSEVFKEIRKQTGYNVLWQPGQVNGTKTINLNIKNQMLNNALDQILKDQKLEYSIEEETVMIKPKEPSFLDRVVSAFASIDVRGIVLDEAGNPLVGATVKVKDLNKSTKTNEKGEFYLQGVDEKAMLVISYLGYVSKEVNSAKDLGKVQMALADSKLEEVEINAGYYKVKDKARTGSISRVDAKTIAQQPISNPLEAMIGRMAGVNIIPQTGVAGGGFSVEIRGRNSLRSTAREPLYLVDGIPYPSTRLTDFNTGVGTLGNSSPLNYLNPFDIESIEVLKDADATAIYGSRGANGVVLITTKKAKEGKTAIDFNFSNGLAKVGKFLPLLNTSQYLEMRKEAFKNDGVGPKQTDFDVNGTWDQNKYTDWQKVLIGGTARLINLQAAITGGDQFTQLSFRGNYSKQGTVFPGDFSDQKGSGNLNVNHTSTDKKFKANFSSSYLVDQNNLPGFDLTQYINLPPNAPDLFNPDGSLNWALDSNGSSTWTNPLSSIKANYTGMSNTFISNALLDYELIPGLFMRSNFGYSTIKLKEDLLRSIQVNSPENPPYGSHYISYNTIETWIIEPQINYLKNIGKGKLDVLVGSTFQSRKQKTESLVGLDYISDALLENITAAPRKHAASSSNQYKYNALFTRINYNYDGKYILNLTGRRDGSSRFGQDKQFANFGAAGLAWIFSDENMFKEKLTFLSFGKFRGSYGVTGSDQIDDYGYLETYTSTTYPYKDGSGLIPSRIANLDYSWETTKKLELALELGFLNDKVLFSSSWYQHRSSNQLVGYSLPDITGFTSIQYNLPATVQNTGWEFEINTTNIKTKSFSWTTAFNLTIPKNKLINYPNLLGSTFANSYTIGESIYNTKGLHYLGLDPQTGLYKFEDLNGNGNDTEVADRKAASKAPTSHLYGGLQNSFNYKSFQLSVFFQFVEQTVRDPLLLFTSPGLISNQLNEVMNRWQKPGDQTSIQYFSQTFPTNGASSRFNSAKTSDLFTDGSFIRCKNISFSWQAPERWTKKIKLHSLRLYLLGQNLFTITQYTGDPEIRSIMSLPSLTTVTAGLQISL